MHQPLGQTQEGIVVQLIDREAKVVLQSFKVKSIEYRMFSLLSQELLQSIESGIIDTQQDSIKQRFFKQHRLITQTPGFNEKLMANPADFYFELFSAAYDLVSKSKSQGF